jgi:quercetin dioxygenase-like cupin family protein
MKIIHYTDQETKTFNQHPAKSVTGRVVIGKADGADHFSMRVFEIAPGGHTPQHTHAWEHEIFIHDGTGEVFRNGEWVKIAKGTVIFIPVGELHQIKNTGASPLVFVCLVPSSAPEL